MIDLSLEDKISTKLLDYSNKKTPINLKEAMNYFESAYLVNAVQKNVWTKDESGEPLAHGGLYIDNVAKSIGTSRKNASYLINQRYNLKPLVDYYSCEKKAKMPTDIEAIIGYKAVDNILSQAYNICTTKVDIDLQKYGNLLPYEKKKEVAQEVGTKYVADLIKELPKPAKNDFMMNRIIEKELPLEGAKKEFEKHFISTQLQDANFAVNECARNIGLSERHLRRKIKEHNITPEQQFYFPLRFLWEENIKKIPKEKNRLRF